MLLKKIVFLTLMVFATLSSFTQTTQASKDSLLLNFQKDSAYIYRFKVFRPYFDVDQYQTYLDENLVTLRGLSVGVWYKNVHVFGIGTNGVIAQDKRKLITRFRDSVNVLERTSLRYISFFYQYSFVNNRYLALFMPTQLGLGRYEITTQDINRTRPALKKMGGIVPSSLGLTLILKPIKWIGISGTGGYRHVLDRNPKLNFNGLFFGYGVWLDIHQILQDGRFYGFRKPRYKRELKTILAQAN